MSIVTYMSEDKQYKKDTADRIDAYNKYVEAKTATIEESRSNELRIRELTYQSLDEGIAEAFSFGKRLFERTQGDVDYLHIYLGKGQVESVNQVKFTKQEFADAEDPLALIPEQLSNKYRFIEGAPIVSNFHDSCGIGIVGTASALQQMLKNISLDVAIRHFYSELKMIYIISTITSSCTRRVRFL